MCLKLAQNGLAHHLILDLFPVCTYRESSLSSEVGGLFGRSGLTDLFSIRGPDKFLRLIIMLTGRPPSAIEFKAMGRKIGKTAIGLFTCTVKKNGHMLHLLLPLALLPILHSLVKIYSS